uniref:SAM domain-containing protein n=1 Tax=Tetradesmus obliquus TaxID=3088 RepID=A0A383W5X0_TETOB|eukprot:jgi/Sobl393_1/9018/SZX72414.1
MGNTCCKLEFQRSVQEASGNLASSTDGLARPFLEAIGLDVYAVAFRVAGYDTQQQLLSLTEQDLDRIQWQSHIPVLPAHRQRILEASRCCAALQGGLAATQQGSAPGAAATQAFSAIMEEDGEGEEPEAAAVTAAAAAATANQEGSSASIDSITAPTAAAGCAALAGQSQQAGQDGAGKRTDEQEASEQQQQAEQAQHMKGAAGAECSGAVDASQHDAQADPAAQQEPQAADSDICDGAADNAAAGSVPAAADAAAAGARVTLPQLFVQKLQLACIPWMAHMRAAPHGPAAAAAQASSAGGGKEAEQQQQQGGAIDEPAVSAEQVPTAVATAGELQPNSEIEEASGAAAATKTPPQAAAAAAAPAEPGPLMANKTALPHSRLLSVQRRPAPTAWAALPSAVASQVFAARPPPRAVQPLAHPAAQQQQQLYAEASSTAVTAAAALQAQRSLLAAAAALAEPSAAKPQAGIAPSTQQQQQARHTSDPGSCSHDGHQNVVVQGSSSDNGCQPQQQWWLQYTPRGQGLAAEGMASTAAAAAAPCSDVPALCASVSPVSKGSGSSRASSRQRGPAAAAAAASLECSSVITGSVVAGALPGSSTAEHEVQLAGCSGSGAGNAYVAGSSSTHITQHQAQLVMPPVPYSLRSPSEMLPSPRRLLQQAGRQQLTASLVRQLSHGGSSARIAAAAAAGARHQDAVHGRTASPEYDPAAAHTTSAWQPVAAEYRGAGAYGRSCPGVQEQSLRQRCSATAVTPLAAGAGAGRRPLNAAHSTLTVDLSRVSMMSGSSMAGSMAGDRPASSRPGSRASDVCSIVSKARERSAARQRLPGGTVTPRDSSSSSSAMLLLSPRAVQQQQQGVAAGAADGASSRGVGQEGAAAAGAAGDAAYAAVAGGEQAMRMLQDYRTMAELDAAIKARVSQLTSNTHEIHSTAAEPSDSAVRAAGSRWVHGSAVGDASSKAARAGKAAAGSFARAAAAPSPEADTANWSDCSPVRQQQQRAGRAVAADAGAAADGAAAAAAAVGLLGIWEALDNSYDAGRPAAAAAAGSGGCGSSWSDRAGARQLAIKQPAADDGGYRNPFLSPSPTGSASPGADVAGRAAAGRDAGRGLQQQRQAQAARAQAW